MKRLKLPRNRVLSFLGLFVSLILLIGLIFYFPPTSSLPLGFFSLPVLILFFPLVTVFLFCLITILSKRPIFGILVSVLSTIYLIFRMNGLTHPFFLFLLVALLITFLLFLKKEK